MKKLLVLIFAVMICFSSVFFVGCGSIFDGDYTVEAGKAQYEVFAKKLNSSIAIGKQDGDTRSINLFGTANYESDLDINGFKIKSDTTEEVTFNSSFTNKSGVLTSDLRLLCKTDGNVKTEVTNTSLETLIQQFKTVGQDYEELLRFSANKEASVDGDLTFDNGVLFYAGNYDIDGKSKNDEKLSLNINTLLGQNDGSWFTAYLKAFYDAIDEATKSVKGDVFFELANTLKTTYGATIYFDYSDNDYRFKIVLNETGLGQGLADLGFSSQTLKVKECSIYVNFNDAGTFTGAKAEYDLAFNGASIFGEGTGIVLNGTVKGAFELSSTDIKVSSPTASKYLDMTELVKLVLKDYMLSGEEIIIW